MLSNEIVLRPRFEMELEQQCSQLLAKFSEAKKNQNKFIVSCIDDHIFIKLPNREQHFWSPQLHLELSEIPENKCSLHGFFRRTQRFGQCLFFCTSPWEYFLW